ncbi:hypothetical protein SDJN03_27796, partial [Cucurbita argyrosperma subsp. sororia]
MGNANADVEMERRFFALKLKLPHADPSLPVPLLSSLRATVLALSCSSAAVDRPRRISGRLSRRRAYLFVPSSLATRTASNHFFLRCGPCQVGSILFSKATFEEDNMKTTISEDIDTIFVSLHI